MKFCVKCGTKIAGGVLCAGCTPREQAKRVRVSHCGVCGRWLSENRWVPARPLRAIVAGLLGVKPSAVPAPPAEGTLHLEHPPATVEIRRVKCVHCAKSPEYFEGVLQLRGRRQETLDEVREFLQAYIGAHPDRMLWVTKSDPHKDGVDLFLASRRGVSELAGRIQAHFGGALNLSPKLFSRSRQTSKAIYRLNALLELPGARVGEVVRTPRGLAVITRLGKPIKATLLESAKRLNLDSADDVVPVRDTTVASVRPFAVIHPDSFQAEPVRNPPPPGAFRLAEPVKVVDDKGLVLIAGHAKRKSGETQRGAPRSSGSLTGRLSC